ncbi:MAG: co-chaperone YbbN [Gammaproteobacteria bacterium]|nr:co-chaperone YbbN [Gammaproteobacteria bacterium]MDH5800904.1 co-chaperone YbbN [Gammaproteobacteria bacterium]
MFHFDVDSSNFQEKVLEASHSTPVLVDFWAPWCGPCRSLKPLLEKLADEYGGKFLLAKVNSDEQSTLAAQFGVRGIPDVRAVVNGAVVDGFSGALPESALRQFLAKIIPSPAEELRQQALNARAEGRLDEAQQLLQQAANLDSDNHKINLDQAALLLQQKKIDEAKAIIEHLPVNVRQEEDVVKLTAEIELQENLRHLPDLNTLQQNIATNPGDLQSRLDLANHYIGSQDYEAAFEQLFEIIKTDRGFKDDIGRHTAVSIFTLLGNNDLVRQYRKRLATLLN